MDSHGIHDSKVGELDTFQHKPFASPWAEIRLLEILNHASIKAEGANEANNGRCKEIYMKTVHASLYDAPHFTAISYTWGSENDMRTVYINSKPMHVRFNCYYALWQCSFMLCSPRIIWIDAICTNQQDVAEKGVQVSLMGEIYSKAESVMVSLGPHYGHSEHVFCCDHEGIREVERLKRAQDYGLVDRLCTRTYMRDVAHRRPLTDYEVFFLHNGTQAKALICSGWADLCQNPYWNRAWVVQELTLAQSVWFACGNDTLGHRQAGHISRLVTKYLSYKNPALGTEGLRSRIQDIRQLCPTVGDSARKYSMERLLEIFVDKQCTDPRDRIFAFLSLLDWDLYRRPALEADYSINVFKLAIQLVDYVPIAKLHNILALLLLTHSTPELRQAVLRTQQPETCHKSEAKPCWRKLWSDPMHIYSVHTQRDGRLYLNTSRHHGIDRSRSFRDVARQGIAAKRIYIGPSIVGIASTAIKAGDLLASVHIDMETEAVYLILRKSTVDYYDVIGQAFSTMQARCIRSALESDPRCAHVELSVTAEDAVVLIGQDFASSQTFCEEERWKRLTTRIMSSATRAAKVHWIN